MKSENPFCYSKPIPPEGDWLSFPDPEVPKIVEDILMRKCCLIIGPPSSGTTSTLLAAKWAYEKTQPHSIWWEMDLSHYPNENPKEFFEALAHQASLFFPNQRILWSQVSTVDEFYRALINSLSETHQILVLAVDHVESTPFSLATAIIRLVRLIYNQRNESYGAQQSIVVIMAGSRRLMRQGVGQGSPLNFAEKYYIQDLEPEAIVKLLSTFDKNWIWTFTLDAAQMIAKETAGDKYLLQRLCYDCIEHAKNRHETTVSSDSVNSVVEHFVNVGFLDDPKLSWLLPNLVEDSETMELILDLINKQDGVLPSSQYYRAHFSASVAQLFAEKGGAVSIRSPIYYRILIRYKPLIESAFRALSQTTSRLEAIREIQDTVSAFEYTFSRKDLKRILERLKNILVASSVHLLSYDEEAQQLQVVDTSQGINTDRLLPVELSNSLTNAFNHEIGRMQCPLADQCHMDKCLGEFEGHCTWIPLRMHGASEFVGALAISGQPLVMSRNWENDLNEIGAILAGALIRQKQFEGLQQLSGLPLNLSEKTFQEEVCRVAQHLFNKPYAFFWRGSLKQAQLDLKAVAGSVDKQEIRLTFSAKELRHYFNQDHDLFVKSCQPDELPRYLLKEELDELGIKALMLICFSIRPDEVGTLGIVSLKDWELTDEDNTLARLLGKQVAVALGNLAAYQEIEQRLEIDRLSIPLLSHELKRWPAAIAEEMELLLSNRIESLRPAQEERIKQAHNYAVQHQQLLQRLIDFTRLDSGRYPLELQLTSISEVLIDIFNNVALTVSNEGRNIDFHVAPDLPKQLVDTTILERIIFNLVQNSIDHTPVATPIRVYTQADGNTTSVVVEDDGPGIPDAYRENLFQAWKRGPRTNQASGSRGNLGIGLFLVKKMAELMNVGITHDADYGPGARFIISFPVDGGYSEATQNTYD